MDQGSMRLSAQPQTSSTAKNRVTCHQPWLASVTPSPRLDSAIWEGGWAQDCRVSCVWPCGIRARVQHRVTMGFPPPSPKPITSATFHSQQAEGVDGVFPGWASGLIQQRPWGQGKDHSWTVKGDQVCPCAPTAGGGGWGSGSSFAKSRRGIRIGRSAGPPLHFLFLECGAPACTFLWTSSRVVSPHPGPLPREHCTRVERVDLGFFQAGLGP